MDFESLVNLWMNVDAEVILKAGEEAGVLKNMRLDLFHDPGFQLWSLARKPVDENV
jgi:hypothetical protein